jgi:Zn-dependent protease with chaperone function
MSDAFVPSPLPKLKSIFKACAYMMPSIGLMSLLTSPAVAGAQLGIAFLLACYWGRKTQPVSLPQQMVPPILLFDDVQINMQNIGDEVAKAYKVNPIPVHISADIFKPAYMGENAIVISRHFAQNWTIEEAKFILGHEYDHYKFMRSDEKMTAIFSQTTKILPDFMGGAALVVACSDYMMGTNTALYAAMKIATTGLLMRVMDISSNLSALSLKRDIELRCDANAARLVQSSETAISALKKCETASPFNFLVHSMNNHANKPAASRTNSFFDEMARSHPPMAKRFENIRKTVEPKGP